MLRVAELKKGGPEVLAQKGMEKRALMLCYPDDFEDSEDSMAATCLRHFTGDTIVHIGEMLGETCCLPSPWVRLRMTRSISVTFRVAFNPRFGLVR